MKHTRERSKYTPLRPRWISIFSVGSVMVRFPSGTRQPVHVLEEQLLPRRRRVLDLPVDDHEPGVLLELARRERELDRRIRDELVDFLDRLLAPALLDVDGGGGALVGVDHVGGFLERGDKGGVELRIL